MTIPILLSGPPRSGKDTLAREILMVCEMEHLSAAQLSIGHRLKDATHAFFATMWGQPAPAWNAFESRKDHLSDFFAGMTPREAYIRMHEDFIKPQLGDTFLAQQVAAQIAKLPHVIAVVPDIGNAEDLFEFEPGVVVQVEREGTEWDNRRPLEDFPGRHRYLRYTSTSDVSQIRRWIKVALLPETFK